MEDELQKTSIKIQAPKMSEKADVKDEKPATQAGQDINAKDDKAVTGQGAMSGEKEHHERAPTPAGSDEARTVVNGNEPEDDGELRATDGRVVISEKDCPEKLGFAFPNWKKWQVISVIFAVQTSMSESIPMIGLQCEANLFRLQT